MYQFFLWSRDWGPVSHPYASCSPLPPESEWEAAGQFPRCLEGRVHLFEAEFWAITAHIWLQNKPSLVSL